jgi:hypothetical protein
MEADSHGRRGFAGLIPGTWLHPAILIPAGFIFAAFLGAPMDMESVARSPQNLQLLPMSPQQIEELLRQANVPRTAL